MSVSYEPQHSKFNSGKMRCNVQPSILLTTVVIIHGMFIALL